MRRRKKNCWLNISTESTCKGEVEERGRRPLNKEIKPATLSRMLPATAIKNGTKVVSKNKNDSSDKYSDSSSDEVGNGENNVAVKEALPTPNNEVTQDSSELSESSDDEDDSAKISAARKSVPVPIKKAVLTTTPKKKDISSDRSECYSNTDDEDDSAKVSTARNSAITPKKKDASSDSSESDSESDDSSESDSESDESSDSDSESDVRSKSDSESDDEDDSAKVSTARKSFLVPNKKAVLTTTPKKKDASSDSSDCDSESDESSECDSASDERSESDSEFEDELPAAKKFRHAGISPEADGKVKQKFNLVTRPDDSSHTAPAPKRLRKDKKDTCAEQVMLSYATRLVEASHTLMQRIATPAIPPCVHLLTRAIRELEKHPEIFDDAKLYDFATVCFLTTTNRVTFLNLPADKRVAWLKNRYTSSSH